MLYPLFVCPLLLFWSLDRANISVGRPKHTRVMAGALQDDLFIGRRAQEYRGLLKIEYPMEHGIVTDWDDMERIWGWVYGEGLKALSEEVSFLVLLVSEGD
jgi:actin-related protein